MTDTQRKRDPRYTRTVGEKPDMGRRYVENGKVKIEWFEDDKRRTRTIGDNNAETRRKADEELERLLGLAGEEPEPEGPAEETDECCECDEDWEVDLGWLVDELRDRADQLMDVADDLAEAFEKGLVRILDAFRGREEPEDRGEDEGEDDPDTEDAEVIEEIKVSDETEGGK